jgi:hypothetical protein
LRKRRTKLNGKAQSTKKEKMEKRGVWEIIDEKISQLIADVSRINGYLK